MKFIAGLRVWGNWGIGENVLKVFLRLRGSANRRVDLFLPLIASIENWPLVNCRQRVNVDVFGNSYAKRTQFRCTEGVTLAGLPCWKPACRQSRPTPGSGGPD